MRKLIAIRKQSRLDDATLSTAPVEEKRELLAKRAQNSERAEDLVEVGFARIEPPTVSNDRFTPLVETEPSFSRLGHVGAYIVNVPTPEWERKAEQQLEDDYELLDNMVLSLPSSTNAKEIRHTSQPRQESQWPMASGIPLAHKKGLSGYGVIVGVLDTGCDADHEEFHNREPIDFIYVNPANSSQSNLDRAAFDSDGHGTHVCDIIAGKKFGIARDVDLMVAAVITEGNYHSTLERVLFGLNWMLTRFNDSSSLDKPMIINMSLGVSASDMEQSYISQNRRLKALLERLMYEYEILPIVAIGNEGAEGSGAIRAPGYYRSTLSVGAVDFKLQPTEYSSYGLSPDGGKMQPDVMGYGQNVYAGYARDKRRTSLYVTKSGTSMATPYVTGVAALYACEEPQLRGAKLRDRLLSTAMKLDEDSDRVGAGLARYVERHEK